MLNKKEPPHYLGHRRRLKDRLLDDPRALAEYEVLELVLGYVNARRDTKPLAKELLARFGSQPCKPAHVQMANSNGKSVSGVNRPVGGFVQKAPNHEAYLAFLGPAHSHQSLFYLRGRVIENRKPVPGTCGDCCTAGLPQFQCRSCTFS